MVITWDFHTISAYLRTVLTRSRHWGLDTIFSSRKSRSSIASSRRSVQQKQHRETFIIIERIRRGRLGVGPLSSTVEVLHQGQELPNRTIAVGAGGFLKRAYARRAG